jgi:hypothetical protein
MQSETIGKILRTLRQFGREPCRMEGPIIRETESFYVVQGPDDPELDDKGRPQRRTGETRFRKASVGVLSRWTCTVIHLEPCPHCADYRDETRTSPGVATLGRPHR